MSLTNNDIQTKKLNTHINGATEREREEKNWIAKGNSICLSIFFGSTKKLS